MNMVNIDKYPERWVAYFDLLGFKNLLNDHKKDPQFILEIYNDVLKELDTSENQNLRKKKILDYCWFSDTFLIWSENNDEHCFCNLEKATFCFFTGLLENMVPVRGAIGYGPFYADKAQSIYIGQALIDAYQYTENQQWLNYVFTPNTTDKMQKVGIAPQKLLKYAPIPADLKNKIYSDNNLRKGIVYAFTYSADDTLGNYIFNYINNMKRECKSKRQRDIQKYENSLSWLEMQKKKWVDIQKK
ncbi:hypothetical protein RBH88_03930 [Aminobacterium sp. MB27-C1]|uniref:hypothetical protein n=1 Tax=Aminobacterium sp. MB27-C1 TaxID=3070661 RepID=UPI0027DD6EDD|nr:hypothetical protein [Aminobacterium sp. MB27-C1]WMI72262.1 hypothetical protein RBH88_03930 [Aminobacterium sp. MB27-C1]